MGSESTRRNTAVPIIEYPENYEQIRKKFLEREEEKLQAVLERRKAESELELQEHSQKSIEKRANRGSSEHKPIKNKTILTEAKSEEIQALRDKLNEEINAIGKRILKELPQEVASLEGKILGLAQLKGRISQKE